MPRKIHRPCSQDSVCIVPKASCGRSTSHSPRFCGADIARNSRSMTVLLRRYLGGLSGVAAATFHSPVAFCTPRITASAERPPRDSADPQARHPSVPRRVSASNRPLFEPSDVISRPRAEIRRSSARGVSASRVFQILDIASTISSHCHRAGWVRHRWKVFRENAVSLEHASGSATILPSGHGHRSS